MSTSNQTVSRRARTRARKERSRRIVAVSVAGLMVAGVAAVAAVGVFRGPVPALAANEPVEARAIQPTETAAVVATAAATSAAPVPARAHVAADTQADTKAAFVKAVADKKAADRKAAAKRAAAKRRAARIAAAREAKRWKKAYCSTFGIGDGLIGSGLAGGGTLKSDSMIVAHRSMPFGTKIKFKYRGRTCFAIVKDRGPYIDGRIFDLGPGTAKKLGFDGVGTVKYYVVKKR